MKENIYNQLIQGISHNTITKIDAYEDNSRLDDEQLKTVLKLLKCNTSVEILTLYHLNESNFKLLSEILEKNITIKTLILCDRNSTRGIQYTKYIANALKVNTGLIKLDMQFNVPQAIEFDRKEYNESHVLLAEALKHNLTLCELHLLNGSYAIEDIQELLDRNKLYRDRKTLSTEKLVELYNAIDVKNNSINMSMITAKDYYLHRLPVEISDFILITCIENTAKFPYINTSPIQIAGNQNAQNLNGSTKRSHKEAFGRD